MRESDLTTAFEREMDELASVVAEWEDTLDVRDMEDLREFSESTCEGLATRVKVEGGNEEPQIPAFLVSLFSQDLWFASVILERQWPRKRQDEARRRVC